MKRQFKNEGKNNLSSTDLLTVKPYKEVKKKVTRNSKSQVSFRRII